MTKIKIYPVKTPVSSDKFVGSDSEDSDKTVNFSFEGVLSLLNSLNGTEAISYIFSNESAGELDENGAGYFISENDIVDPQDLTSIIVSKSTISGIDLSQLFTYIDENKEKFNLNIRNLSDPNNFIYFQITDITEQLHQFTFELTIDVLGGYLGNLINTDVYCFQFLQKNSGTSSNIEMLDYPRLLSPQTDFELPSGAIALFAKVNYNATYLPETTNTTGELNQFVQTGTTVTFNSELPIGNYVAIFYKTI